MEAWKKLFFPSLLYVRSQIHFSVLLFFLTPGKCGDYLLTCIPFTSLCIATPPCRVMSRPPRRRHRPVPEFVRHCLRLPFYSALFHLFPEFRSKMRRVYIGESLKMTGRNVSVTQLAAVSGFVFHRRRNWSKMSCQMAYIRSTLCASVCTHFIFDQN